MLHARRTSAVLLSTASILQARSAAFLHHRISVVALRAVSVGQSSASSFLLLFETASINTQHWRGDWGSESGGHIVYCAIQGSLLSKLAEMTSDANR